MVRKIKPPIKKGSVTPTASQNGIRKFVTTHLQEAHTPQTPDLSGCHIIGYFAKSDAFFDITSCP